MSLDGAAALLLLFLPCCLLRLVGIAVAAAAAAASRLTGRHCPAAATISIAAGAISTLSSQLQSCQLVRCSGCCRAVCARMAVLRAAAVVRAARPAPAAGQRLLSGAGLLAALGRVGVIPVRGLCRRAALARLECAGARRPPALGASQRRPGRHGWQAEATGVNSGGQGRNGVASQPIFGCAWDRSGGALN